MVCVEFTVALISFLNPVLLTILLIVSEGPLVLYFVGLLFSVSPLFAIFGARHEDIIYRAYFIGFVCTLGLIVTWYSSHTQLGLYLIGLAAFHISEYLLTALYKPTKLSNDSFLLNHSTAYHCALGAGLFEYLVEYVNLGSDKFSWPWISLLGGCMMFSGDVFRKLAMITAAENFDHIVQTSKAENHQLVTHGVYSVSRHPSYAGWFYWSIGTQILLCNPVCTAGYAFASWKFFSERIEEEECYLIRFFGAEYLKYKQAVGIGIPFINGFQVSPEFLQFVSSTKEAGEANKDR